MTDTALIAGLRAWTRTHDPHVRAAVELLIDHDDALWLRREDFTDRFVRTSGGQTAILFDILADALSAGDAPGGAETATAILRFGRRPGHRPVAHQPDVRRHGAPRAGGHRRRHRVTARPPRHTTAEDAQEAHR